MLHFSIMGSYSRCLYILSNTRTIYLWNKLTSLKSMSTLSLLKKGETTWDDIDYARRGSKVSSNKCGKFLNALNNVWFFFFASFTRLTTSEGQYSSLCALFLTSKLLSFLLLLANENERKAEEFEEEEGRTGYDVPQGCVPCNLESRLITFLVGVLNARNLNSDEIKRKIKT